jgi:hypothetical protein
MKPRIFVGIVVFISLYFRPQMYNFALVAALSIRGLRSLRWLRLRQVDTPLEGQV